MVKIDTDDLKRLAELWKKAENTPMISIGTVQLGTQAWQKVKDFFDELGKKYGFNPFHSIINPETGEVTYASQLEQKLKEGAQNRNDLRK